MFIHDPLAFATNNLTTVLVLASVYGGAAIFSGLSGFGFSSIGCLSLIVLPPAMGVTLLMALSLLTQAASFSSLWTELRQHAGQWNKPGGVFPFMAGGVVGMPFGIKILATFGSTLMMEGLGVLLIGYSVYSLFKPSTLVLNNRVPTLRNAFMVGAAGGVVGGFSAFPGAAIVVWNGLVGASKEQGRALTQPFILFMQIVGLALLCLAHPDIFSDQFWMIFMAAVPVALLGNRLGLWLYRRTGDIGYRRITFIALGVSGLGLLLKISLTMG